MKSKWTIVQGTHIGCRTSFLFGAYFVQISMYIPYVENPKQNLKFLEDSCSVRSCNVQWKYGFILKFFCLHCSYSAVSTYFSLRSVCLPLAINLSSCYETSGPTSHLLACHLTCSIPFFSFCLPVDMHVCQIDHSHRYLSTSKKPYRVVSSTG